MGQSAGPAPATLIRGEPIRVDQIDEHPDNASLHSEQDIAYLAASLKRYGQPRDLIVRRKGKRYQLIAGHGVRKAMLQRGDEYAYCTIVPDEWSDVDAAGYLLIDNHRADQDERRLLILWDQQIDAGADLESVGVERDEVEEMRMMLALDETIAGQERAPARGRAVTDEQQHRHIKLVLYMPQIELAEAAIRKTGLQNRGDAAALIFQAFLENDWLPPD